MSKVNQTIQALTEYSHGGKSSAVVPGEKTLAEKILPEGKLPPGAEEGLEFIEKALSGHSSDPRWLFLVGGPGNGKSWISRSLQEKYDLIETAAGGDTLAKREYSYDVQENPLVILNDGTITLENGQKKSLLGDLRRYRAESKNLVANLNRGVIIEDLPECQGDDAEWVSDLLNWLLEEDDALESLKEYKVEIDDKDFPGAARRFRLETGEGEQVEVMVSFLDKHSLLETGGEISKVGEADCKKRLDTAGGQLVRDLTEEHFFEEADPGCSGCALADRCPFLTNVKTLRAGDGQVISGMLDIFRAAEVASGSPFTYREIWSLLAQAILGRWQPVWGEQHPCEWVAEQDALDLHKQRIHRALFPRWGRMVWRWLG